MKKVSAEVLNLDVEKLIEMLNAALCEEWLAYYQYWVGARIMEGPMRIPIEAELLEHANEELKHAEMLIERIISWEARRCSIRCNGRRWPAASTKPRPIPTSRRFSSRTCAASVARSNVTRTSPITPAAWITRRRNGGGYSRGRARTRERYRFVPGRHRRDERRDRKNGEIARAVYRWVIEASGRPIGPP